MAKNSRLDKGDPMKRMLAAMFLVGCAGGEIVPDNLNTIVTYPGQNLAFFRVMTKGVGAAERVDVVGEWLGEKAKCPVQDITFMQTQTFWTKVVEDGEEKEKSRVILNGSFSCKPTS